MKLAHGTRLIPLLLLGGTLAFGLARSDELLGCNSRSKLLEWREGSLTMREALLRDDSCRWMAGERLALAPDGRDPQLALATVLTKDGAGMRMWVNQ